ncbi:CxxH/CxxC protein [Alkalihalobacillus sp. BA299]|uniref:CxxH/CxxC protein n=1 Tax=Alkalihalobacillus sp. BA299 TaxID=2815938 RepID=UPI001ADB8DC7|nr:CxxH/CxxC protein [Alkalihalobacillus sp. BA299]
MKYLSCKDHVELAMEHIIDECEAAPNMEILSEQQKLSTTCSFCEQEPIYRITD